MAFVTRAPYDDRARRSPVTSFLLETVPPPAVRRRDRRFRQGLLLADVIAGLFVAGLVELTVSSTPLLLYAVLLPVLVVVVHTASGMYERDEKLINKSTLDET